MTDQNTPRVYDKAKDISANEIPVIDLHRLRHGMLRDRQAVADKIAEACRTVGFFYISGHGIAQSLIDDAFGANKAFFDQPFEKRMESAATKDWWRGYVPTKQQGEGGAVGGSIQTYRFMLDLPEDDPDVVMRKPMHLPNRWVDHLPGFNDTMQTYMAEMEVLSALLRRAFALGLGLPEGWFDPFYRRPLIQQSLLFYPKPPSQREEDFQIGAGEHRDTGAFTILMQDDAGGLEVGHLEQEWVAARPIKGTYVINIGDMMMRWTNGRFISTMHRVVNRSVKDRYSMPYFANPDYDSIISPVPCLVEPGTTNAYPPLHFGQFMDDFYKKGMSYLDTAPAA
ncbi:isopenicillin N synthase family dioxygenase [Roseisalinus antarcticus]|uniref:2-oxoglutarate-dependent ethylene/succinate-forming enzyme n=1 Tax=Roseisalinus antarcticus TaxID=254357 RepID=A0A1Y5SP24_9RHOB|nr:2-oxoglutarate and iron-dependent oxygenase domain-containing protein [Roseisalinus antarcticus]SLN42046.1 2-oxoglutarate-dependent ethylene/succinate-forming enzyme [Roseisalinus antarcticus]